MFKKRGQPKEYRGFFARNRLAIAVSTLVGTIIGAGILGLPYAIAKCGFALGMFWLLFIGISFLFLHLFAGEIVLRTKKQHQWPIYVGKYLGKWGKYFMTFSMVISIYGALTAYLIGEGEALKTIFGFGQAWSYALIFFVISSYIVYRGIKSTGKAELILISLMILVVFLIGIFSYDEIKLTNLEGFHPENFFFPYGIILFSFIGLAAIPELREELGPERKKMKKAIIIGSTIPIIIYILFALLVVGIVGLNNFESLLDNQKMATVALSIFTNSLLGKFVNILAVLTMFTSFLALGTALIELYHFDYLFSRKKAFLLTFILPLLLFLFNVGTFIKVIAFTGAVAGGLDGILIVLSYWKAKTLGERKPEYSLPKHTLIGLILIILFVLGIGYQLFFS